MFFCMGALFVIGIVVSRQTLAATKKRYFHTECKSKKSLPLELFRKRRNETAPKRRAIQVMLNGQAWVV
jgi:hypothetical protein